LLVATAKVEIEATAVIPTTSWTTTGLAARSTFACRRDYANAHGRWNRRRDRGDDCGDTCDAGASTADAAAWLDRSRGRPLRRTVHERAAVRAPQEWPRGPLAHSRVRLPRPLPKHFGTDAQVTCQFTHAPIADTGEPHGFELELG
jgi:hypothetical protein